MPTATLTVAAQELPPGVDMPEDEEADTQRKRKSEQA
jgi:hypothetical protein